jgi:hypothetical protein
MLNEMFPTVSKSNTTTVGTENLYPNTRIHDRSFSWIGADTSIKQVG